jgi:hypothetical protein
MTSALPLLLLRHFGRPSLAAFESAEPSKRLCEGPSGLVIAQVRLASRIFDDPKRYLIYVGFLFP